ncbi:transient-receptor-potential-like protein [Diadema setosum]|uniref:transient-receptor-potential-like protein n=1 Tax=Diadema setosum TaxID=31175 RepID=UPI003B3BDF6C
MHTTSSTTELNPHRLPTPAQTPSRHHNSHLPGYLSVPGMTANGIGSDLSLISGVSNIPLQLFSEGQRITPKEREFLEAAEKGDKASIVRCLQGENPVNVNVSNLLGRSALQMAVDNENLEIVELLLAQPDVEIGDALLQAIREGVYRMVEMMVNHPSISRQMLGEGWASANKSRRQESSDYSPDISPVILAAHCNQFEILQLLLTRGATIYKPHPCVCACAVCEEKQKQDSLRYSLDRINTYRALASPAWISLTSSDPVLTAFKLSWELQRLAMRENEFKDMYVTLSEQAKAYAVDLLEQCRSSEEVIALLNKESMEDDDDSNYDADELNAGKLTLSRLKLALKYEQKKFVAHPHTQQLLASIWYEGLPGWRRRNWFVKSLICIGLICLFPFMAMYYLIFPRTPIGTLLRSPFMKFLNHSASFLFFLFLLVMASASPVAREDSSRGRTPDTIESLILVFVLGMIWAECKQLWEEGLRAYIRQWWNWLDFIMLSLYLCTFSLRLVAAVQRERGMYDPDEYRLDWHPSDPTVLSEGVFAVANVFSFARIIYLFQANPYLGPLQISLGCMLIDIAKFLLIFFLVLFSFACGLNKLYSNYLQSIRENVRAENATDVPAHDFEGLVQTLLTLMWALFGLVNTDKTRLPQDESEQEDPEIFVETVGELLFLVYHLMAIVVLLNMLIAMMSNSFQIIEDHADREWKFARSKLWMSYFDEGSTLPPPFNLIISPKSVVYAALACRRLFRVPLRKNKHSSRPKRGCSMNDSMKNVDGSIGPNSSPEYRYQDVMKRLVNRYIHQCKAERKADGVNEDDLNEIKQDISSLRYELREDRKREEARGNSNMHNIRRDIIRIVRNTNSTSDPASVASEIRSQPSGGNSPDQLHSPGPEKNMNGLRPILLSSHMSAFRRLDTLDARGGGNYGNGNGVSITYTPDDSELEELTTRSDLATLKQEIMQGIRLEVQQCLQTVLQAQNSSRFVMQRNSVDVPTSPPPPVPPPPLELDFATAPPLPPLPCEDNYFSYRNPAFETDEGRTKNPSLTQL